MRRLVRNKRGISPIIATLLLIAIAVAAAVVTYSWVMSMITTDSAQSETSIRIDFVQFNSHGNGVNVTIRNAGAIPATIDKIYITALNSTGAVDTLTYVSIYTASDDQGRFYANSKIVPVASTIPFNCTLASTAIGHFTTGQPYQIEVMTTTGFYIEGTYYA
jgi:flagellin-like protein